MYEGGWLGGVVSGFDIVKCDRADGGGCGARWLEGMGTIHLKCPRCGGRTDDGNIVVNDEGAPDVSNLDRDDVMVVYGGVEA